MDRSGESPDYESQYEDCDSHIHVDNALLVFLGGYLWGLISISVGESKCSIRQRLLYKNFLSIANLLYYHEDALHVTLPIVSINSEVDLKAYSRQIGPPSLHRQQCEAYRRRKDRGSNHRRKSTLVETKMFGEKSSQCKKGPRQCRPLQISSCIFPLGISWVVSVHSNPPISTSKIAWNRIVTGRIIRQHPDDGNISEARIRLVVHMCLLAQTGLIPGRYHHLQLCLRESKQWPE